MAACIVSKAMVSQGSFGRRAGTTRQSGRGRDVVQVIPQNARAELIEISVAPPSPLPEEPESPSLDQELREWKKSRRFEIPWRQLSIMASLCFGIGSLVLPDSVNDSVHYLLYALTGLSLYAGFKKRRRAAQN
jgi:hypothetical protein